MSRCPEQSIYYIYYLLSYLLDSFMRLSGGCTASWPAHLSFCPQTCCCHAQYPLNGASVLTVSLHHPGVVKVYLNSSVLSSELFTPADLLNSGFVCSLPRLQGFSIFVLLTNDISGARGSSGAAVCGGFAVRICWLLFGLMF